MFASLLLTAHFAIAPPGQTQVLVNRPTISQALFHPDGKRLYCVTAAGTEAFDTTTGQRLFDAPHGRNMVCSPFGDKIALIETSIGMINIAGQVTVLDGATGKLLHQGPGTSAAFSPDGRWLISHSGYNIGHPATDLPPKVQITDLTSGKMHLAQLASANEPSAVGFGSHRAAGNFHFTKDGKVLVSRVRIRESQFKSESACELATGIPVKQLPKDDELHPPPISETNDNAGRFVKDWKVFEATSGEEISKLESVSEKADSWNGKFQMSADGKSVFTVTGSKMKYPEAKAGRVAIARASTLHIWDADTGKLRPVSVEAKCRIELPAITGKKTGNAYRQDPRFAINRQGTIAIDYNADGIVTVWDLATGKMLRKIRETGHSARPEILAFSSDSKLLASASTEGEVILWDANTGTIARTMDRAANLADLKFRPKSKELVGVGHNLIYVWNVETGVLIRTFERKGNLFRLAFHPDGKLAAFSDHWSETTELIDIESGDTKQTFRMKCASIAFHADGKRMLTLDPSGAVSLFVIDSGKRLHHWFGGKSADYRYRPGQIAFLGDGSRFLLSENNTYSIVDAATGKPLVEHKVKLESRYDIHCLSVHPKGDRIAIGEYSSQPAQELDVQSGKQMRTYAGHHVVTSRVLYSPDGARLATVGQYDFVIRIHPVPIH